jgi:glycopeptide antibiotics resistance protein
LALIAYGAALIYVVVFKGLSHNAPPARPQLQARPPTTQPRTVIIRWGANFVPLKTILSQLRGEPRWPAAVANLAGNTVLFVPVGFLVPLVYRKMTWRKSLAVGVAVGVAMEGMEWVFHVGVVDVDDVILNALGVMVGYWVFTVFERRRLHAAALAGA